MSLASIKAGYSVIQLFTLKESNQLVGRIILASLSGLMLAMPLLNPNWYIFSWCAFVPLLLAIEGKRKAYSYGLASVCGLVFYTCSCYWISDYIHLFKGYGQNTSLVLSLIFWLYCSQLIAILIVLFTWLKERSLIHSFILFPLVVVLVFEHFPMLFSVQLAETQSLFLTAIQGTDTVGVNGLDALIALVNITLYHLLFRPQSTSYLTTSLVALVLCVWFTYGFNALSFWDNEINHWPTLPVGLVQPNETPDLAKPPIYPGFSQIYPPEMHATQKLASLGAQWVIWPEARYKGYLDLPKVKKSFEREVKNMNVNLIFHDMEQGSDKPSNENIKNKAVFIDRHGQAAGQHQKIKLVAFGEYTPLVNTLPFVADIFKDFFGNFTRQIIPGEGHKNFEHDGLNMIPLICNETMHSQFTAQAVGNTPRHMLIGLSSNGWFGKTLQPYQHTYTSSLRAVENRLPFVHALNNGPSLAILPSGREIFQSEYHQAGAYLLQVPYLPKGSTSFYSRHPKLFMSCVYFCLTLVLLLIMRAGIRSLSY